MKNRVRNYNGVAHYETDGSMVLLGDGGVLDDVMPTSMICVSEGTEEKMTHSNTTIFYKGVFFSVHTSDSINTVEDPRKCTTKIVLTEKSMLHLNAMPVQRTVVEIGTPIGNFTQSPYRSPYDPNMYIDENGIAWIFFIGVDSSGGGETFCIRKFDTKTSKHEDSVTKCTLDGILMDNVALNASHNKYKSGANGSDFNISCSIIKASDGYYYTGVGASGTYYGMIIRSLNLVDWESVSVANANSSVWEVELAEVEQGKLAVAMRAGGCSFGWFTISTKTWVTPTTISSSIAARPHIINHKDKWYLLCNVSGRRTTADYGTVERATLGVYEITSSGVTQLKKLVNDFGIHYVKATHDYNGKLWIAYSTDPRRLDASQARSSIAMENLNL